MASWRHENKEYFDKISVSVVYSVCSSCYYSIGFDGTCGFAVLDDFIFGFAVSNTPQCPAHLGKFPSFCTGLFKMYNSA